MCSSPSRCGDRRPAAGQERTSTVQPARHSQQSRKVDCIRTGYRQDIILAHLSGIREGKWRPRGLWPRRRCYGDPSPAVREPRLRRAISTQHPPHGENPPFLPPDFQQPENPFPPRRRILDKIHTPRAALLTENVVNLQLPGTSTQSACAVLLIIRSLS